MHQLLPGLAAVVAQRTVFQRHEAVAAGYDDRSIKALRRAGEWVSVRHGAYVLGATWQDADERERAILRAIAVVGALRSEEAVLSHGTSALLHGAPTWNLPLHSVHLTRTVGHAGRVGLDVHRHRSEVPAERVSTTRGLRHTDGARAVVEVLAAHGVETALCVGDDLLRREVTTREAIEATLAAARHWPGTLGAEVLLARLDPRHESVGETRTHHLCVTHGLHGGVPQYEVRIGGRVLAYLDLGFPGSGFFIEFDGKVKYAGLRRAGESPEDVVWREKRRQDAVCNATGWECARVTWADLENPTATAATLRAVAERGRQRMRTLRNRPS